MIYNIFGNLSRITKDELDNAYLPKHNGRYMIELGNLTRIRNTKEYLVSLR